MYCLSSVSGGAVSYLRNSILLLRKQFEDSSKKHNLQILAHESQKELLSSVYDAQCTWITGPRPAGWRRIVWEWQNMPRIAQDTNADVLFSPYQVGPRVKGLKQVLMIRNMEPFLFEEYRYGLKSLLRNHLLRWQSSRALCSVDRVIAVSGFVEDQLKEGLDIPPERIRRVYHGRDMAFSPDGDPDEDRGRLEAIGVEGDFLLTCGSFLPYRRCEDVISAFNLCADSLGANIKLVIAGSGSDARYANTIRRAISASPYRERILAVGHVSKGAMISLYRGCLACILATEVEACPNIAIEAMSSGCEIVSSDRPPLPEVLAGCSLQFRARDIEDLVVQIKRSVTDSFLRKDMKKKALERANDFSWEKCARETYSALVDW